MAFPWSIGELKSGVPAPSLLFGSDFILQFEGVRAERNVLSQRIQTALHESGFGPLLPSLPPTRFGSYQRASCRQRRPCMTVEDDPKLKSSVAV
jgi:hypothetical protein